MSLSDVGPAAVLVYGDGRREAALLHSQDGGEAYMGPLLRKAVQYAKTHYDCGNITDVLMSEGEMHRLGAGDDVLVKCICVDVRHVYYVAYRWDAETSRKTYRISTIHLDRPVYASDLPDRLGRGYAPKGARRLV